MSIDTHFGKEYLQRRIATEFALALHIGVVVEAADADTVVLRAPLAPNANYKGSAFGGSLFSLAVLAGWAWLTRHLAEEATAADVVIQSSSIDYLEAVHGEFVARSRPPCAADLERFARMLRRAGRGRIRIGVEVHQGTTLATRFEGVYAAVPRDA
jgi:thioesterase domain-containing protein